MKRTVQTITREEELIIAGETFSESNEIGQVVRAKPIHGGGDEYIRLQYEDGRSWKWIGPLADWSHDINVDADSSDFDARWVGE